MRLSLLTVCSLLFCFSYGQDPCKTFPNQGYAGKCNITMLMTEDGKHVYTSNQLTLKKWDVETKLVVEETPFPHKVVATTGDPDIIVVENSKRYNLKTKRLIDELGEFLASLGPEGTKAFDKVKKQGHARIIYDTQDRFIFIEKDSYILQLSLSTYKVITLFQFDAYKYDQDLNTFFYLEPKTKMFSSLNVSSGKKFETNTKGLFGSMESAPRGLYYMLKGDRDLKFLDRNFKEVAKVPFSGRIKWSSDSSSFYVYGADYYNNLFYYVNGFVQEYSYPELKLVNRLNENWYKDQYRYLYYFVDPSKKMVFVHQGSHAQRDEKPVLLGYDIATSSLKDSISFRYTLTPDQADLQANDREQRRKIGNRAIEALYSMSPPESFHSLGQHKLIDDFTPQGKVLIREQASGTSILWSFPEGNAVRLYHARNTIKTSGIGPGAIAIPANNIYKAHLSPSGKFVGLITEAGALVYEGATLRFTLEGKELVALLDQYVLAADYKGETLEVLDILSGKTLYKIKDGKPSNTTKIEKHHHPTKAFFYNQYGFSVFDSANPSVLYRPVGAEHIKAAGFGPYYFDGRNRKNYETGKTEPVPGYRPPQFEAGSVKEQFQHNYILYADAIEGLKIWDARTAQSMTPKPLYSGWNQINAMVYLKDLNKVLVLNNSPVYSKPNAAPEDPAASAYTFDISTGAITPYLLTENRASMLANLKHQEERLAAWEYAAKSNCRYGLKFADGTTIRRGDNYLIVLGYDCEEKVYIVSTRELYQEAGGGTRRQRVRIEKRTPLDLSVYESIGSVWEICKNCAGQPERTHVSTFTGWTEWEQQNFNIYTRKFVTNKKVEERTQCKLCEGGWQKKAH